MQHDSAEESLHGNANDGCIGHVGVFKEQRLKLCWRNLEAFYFNQLL